MSAKSLIKVVNLQFIPDLIELPIGGEIDIKILDHPETALYSSSQRKFIIQCSEFETPELSPGNSFKWKFNEPGKYILTCSLYSWMKCTVQIIAFENPQDPDMVIHKPGIKVQTKNKSTQMHVKPTLRAPSIASSVASEEEEIHDVPSNDEKIEKEIEKLFLQVKEECERDRVGPANFLQEIEEETFEIRERVTRNKDTVNIEREEKKGKVVFTTITVAPAKYFSEYKIEKKDKSKMKNKKTEKNFRRKFRTNKDFAWKVLGVIIKNKIVLDKIALGEQEFDNEKKAAGVELDGIKVSMSMNQAKKVDEFLGQRCFEVEYDEFFQRNLACKLFGMNHLWWAEDIFNRPGTSVLNYQSSLNEKNVDKFLSQSKTYTGWNEEF